MIRAHANGLWFTAVPAEQRVDYYGDAPIEETEECRGCLFDKKGFGACRAATEAARAADLPDCESRPDLGRAGFIYVADPSAGRQLDLLTDSPTKENDGQEETPA